MTYLTVNNNLLDVFKSSRSLTELNLSNNSLTEISSEVLSQLGNLKIIDLSFNEFTKISSEVSHIV